MGRYFAVMAVQDEGQELTGPAPASRPAVPAGARLVAIVDNGEWQVARDVTDPDAYRTLYRRHDEGLWKRMRLFLIDDARAAALEDGRRVLMDGRPISDPGRRL